MRKIVVQFQSTLNNRIATDQGTFWEPFPWGDPEQAYVNEVYRAADTIVLSRVMYDAIVPWWEMVAAGQVPEDVPDVSPTYRDFAAILQGMRKVVISRTWASAPDREVIGGDLVQQLTELKQQPGDADIVLACGPGTLGPVASAPGVIDEYLVALHPVVLAAGPGLFDHLSRDLALELTALERFDGGVVILRYRAPSA